MRSSADSLTDSFASELLCYPSPLRPAGWDGEHERWFASDPHRPRARPRSVRAVGLRLHREPPPKVEFIVLREAFLQTARFTKQIDNIWVLRMHRGLVLSP